MEQNVIVSVFDVESEGYQAITELKKDPGNKQSLLMEAVLVKKENDNIVPLDSYDTGANTLDDMAIGGVAGALIGILGGPVGVLLGSSYGALVGASVDTGDALINACMIEQIAGKLGDNCVALIGLAAEEDEAVLDAKLSKYQAVTARFDAAVVAEEVDEAQKMAIEMARQARRELRSEKKADFKQKVADRRTKIAADFADFLEKFKDA